MFRRTISEPVMKIRIATSTAQRAQILSLARSSMFAYPLILFLLWGTGRKRHEGESFMQLWHMES